VQATKQGCEQALVAVAAKHTRRSFPAESIGRQVQTQTQTNKAAQTAMVSAAELEHYFRPVKA